MKMSEMFVSAMNAYNETLDQLQVEDYVLINKRDLPPEVIRLKTIEIQTLRYKAELLKEEIITEASHLGKNKIEDFDSFAVSFRSEQSVDQ